MDIITIAKKYSIPLAIIVFVTAVLLLTLNASTIHRQLNAWKLLPQPERLTELYYENHSKLPTTYTPDAPQEFSFTVHNLEYRTTNYTYEIVEQSEDASQSQVVTTGSFSLRHDDFKTTKITVSPVDLGPRVKIITTLKNSNESIHYWVTKQDGEGV